MRAALSLSLSLSLSLAWASSTESDKKRGKIGGDARLIEMRITREKNGTESDEERNDRATRDVSF